MIVYRRTGVPVPMQDGRDVWWDEAVEGQPPVCDPVWVEAEHPLFLLYTSGSTGKPKGIQHLQRRLSARREDHQQVGVRPAR